MVYFVTVSIGIRIKAYVVERLAAHVRDDVNYAVQFIIFVIVFVIILVDLHDDGMRIKV